MAEDEQQQSPRRRRSPAKKKSTTTTRSKPSADRSAHTPDFSGTDGGGALDIEQDTFVPPEEPAPADVEDDLEPYQVGTAEPIDWSPDRAGTIVRAGGYLLHTADSMAREEGGEDLWRATEADIDAIGAPLARILNRYEPTRRVAGYSDEGELLLGVAGYARRNLAERGRLVTAKRQAEEAEAAASGYVPGTAFGDEPGHDERQ